MQREVGFRVPIGLLKGAHVSAGGCSARQRGCRPSVAGGRHEHGATNTDGRRGTAIYAHAHRI